MTGLLKSISDSLFLRKPQAHLSDITHIDGGSSFEVFYDRSMAYPRGRKSIALSTFFAEKKDDLWTVFEKTRIQRPGREDAFITEASEGLTGDRAVALLYGIIELRREFYNRQAKYCPAKDNPDNSASLCLQTVLKKMRAENIDGPALNKPKDPSQTPKTAPKTQPST